MANPTSGPTSIVLVPGSGLGMPRPVPPQNMPRYLSILGQEAEQKAPEPEVSFLQALGQTLVSGVTGMSLGALHAELKDGLDVNGKPLDLAGWLAAFAGGTVYKSKMSLLIANSCMTVFNFRKTESLLTAIKEARGETSSSKAPASSHSSEVVTEDNDPLLALDRELG